MLLKRMIHAHGGRERWNATQGFSAYVSISGFLIPSLPYVPENADRTSSEQVSPHRKRPRTVELAVEGDTHCPHLRIFGATDAALYGIYTPGCSEVRALADDVSVSRISPGDRPSSAASASSPAEVIAVLGAFLWNALVGPFVLAREGQAYELGGKGEHDCLDVVLPDHIDPISPQRSLTIDKAGMVLQSSYDLRLIQNRRVVETMKAYCDFDGIRIATLRRIALASPAATPEPLTLVDIEIFDVRFR